MLGEGGSIPIITSFKPPLRADSLLIGFGPPDASTHALNESLDLEVFAKAIAASRRLLVKLKRG
ncbi:MAG: M20 family dipeptidase [Verrucomicrobia bacterium]|nr:M20 family dipeptidase [Verrucomicrobiota bacterium]